MQVLAGLTGTIIQEEIERFDQLAQCDPEPTKSYPYSLTDFYNQRAPAGSSTAASAAGSRTPMTSQYSTLTVKALKTKLKDRGEKQAGTKAELVARLDACPIVPLTQAEPGELAQFFNLLRCQGTDEQAWKVQLKQALTAGSLTLGQFRISRELIEYALETITD